jgi:diaminohydroxyphosphoribosylaminopyrimidine deaminase/5-amino-6-(5-phosphoribosylamino)uracil reductase
MALRDAGAEVLTCPPTDSGRIDLDAMLCQLGGRTPPVTSVLVEGGGVLASALLEADLVDELIWFIAPSFFGAGVPATSLSQRIEQRFTLASAESLGPDAMLTYRRVPRED